jgi:hypothetical protein
MIYDTKPYDIVVVFTREYLRWHIFIVLGISEAKLCGTSQKTLTALYIAVFKQTHYCTVYQRDSPDHGFKGKQNYIKPNKKKTRRFG